MNWNDQKDNRYIFTVSELNNSAKKTLENSFSDIWIKGEISNFKSYPSGHWYFTLKDEESQIQCVMFKFKNSLLNFIPKEGDEFIALGSASMYLARGNYQFQVESLEKDGIGRLYEEYEKLKTRLTNQGLFDESNKLEIPSYPQKIGLITSEKGAVLQDIKNVLNRRAPSIEVNLFSSLVQGEEAEQSILKNLNLINKIQPQYKYDLLVFARGGGSIEDLWVFNSEKIALAISKLNIPTISAIGHETDFTICDFVCDLRAPTPSGAAEIISSEIFQFPNSLENYEKFLNKVFFNNLNFLNQEVKNLSQRIINPKNKINENILKLDESTLRLHNSFSSGFNKIREIINFSKRTIDLLNPSSNLARFKENINDNLSKIEALYSKHLNEKQNLITSYSSQIEQLSPFNVLERGYSIVRNKKGVVVKSKDDISMEDKISITSAKISYEADITNINND